jgi:hypothetical protein
VVAVIYTDRRSHRIGGHIRWLLFSIPLFLAHRAMQSVAKL